MYNTDIPTRAELPSTKQLLRSTGLAIATAAILLSTVVLPAEYGIDPTGIGQGLGLTAMGAIKASLAAEAKADKAASPPTVASQANSAGAKSIQPVATQAAAGAMAASRTDEMSVTLKPGEATEVKLAMAKGARVTYSWRTGGGLVNYDTHGDPLNGPKGAYHGYSKGKQVGTDAGEFAAAFDGNHGWFWRNRADKDVTITLKTSGDYKSIKKML